MILSFAWTSKALLDGKKTCSRRIWSDRTARAWVKAYNDGRLVHQAWNQAPFCKGARKIANIRLTKPVYQEQLADMPDADLDAEGGLWASKEEFFRLFGGDPGKIVWVVRFELANSLEIVEVSDINALAIGQTRYRF